MVVWIDPIQPFIGIGGHVTLKSNVGKIVAWGKDTGAMIIEWPDGSASSHTLQELQGLFSRERILEIMGDKTIGSMSITTSNSSTNNGTNDNLTWLNNIPNRHVSKNSENRNNKPKKRKRFKQ